MNFNMYSLYAIFPTVKLMEMEFLLCLLSKEELFCYTIHDAHLGYKHVNTTRQRSNISFSIILMQTYQNFNASFHIFYVMSYMPAAG